MAKPNFVIRKAEKDDCPEIRRLIQELADYEKFPDGPQIGAKELQEDGFGSNPFFQCLVAEYTDNPDHTIIGYALYYFTYSTWEGKSVYMEDLYVTPKARGQGVGVGMWKRLVQMSLDIGCTRCNFSVLDWNKPSIELYERCGAVNLTQKEGWQSFRMEKAAMEAFVKSDMKK